jgi:hypothetical protein
MWRVLAYVKVVRMTVCGGWRVCAEGVYNMVSVCGGCACVRCCVCVRAVLLACICLYSAVLPFIPSFPFNPPFTLQSFLPPFNPPSCPLFLFLFYQPFSLLSFNLQQSTDVTTGGIQEGQSDIPRPPDGIQPTESTDQDPSLSPSRLYGRALQTPSRDLPGQEEGEGEGAEGEGMMRDVERDVQTSHGKPG